MPFDLRCAFSLSTGDVFPVVSRLSLKSAAAMLLGARRRRDQRF